jgi:flagellar basal body L-ring protein FlgH
MRNWLAATLLLIAVSLASETLWVPEFQGYLGGRQSDIAVGDVINVTIDAVTAVEFSAQADQSHVITIQLAGGQDGDLLSFLPQGATSANRAARRGQDTAVAAVMAARVVQVDLDGTALVEGVRTLTIDDRLESLSVTGRLDPRFLGGQRRVMFSQLADARLTIRTYLSPTTTPISVADLVTSLQAVTGAVAGIPAPQAPVDPGALVEAGASQAEAAVPPSLQLSPARQQELLLQYLNALLGLIFQ